MKLGEFMDKFDKHDICTVCGDRGRIVDFKRNECEKCANREYLAYRESLK